MNSIDTRSLTLASTSRARSEHSRTRKLVFFGPLESLKSLLFNPSGLDERSFVHKEICPLYPQLVGRIINLGRILASPSLLLTLRRPKQPPMLLWMTFLTWDVASLVPQHLDYSGAIHCIQNTPYSYVLPAWDKTTTFAQ